MTANSPGRPITLTPDVLQRLIDAVPHVIIPAQVAALARVPKQTLSDWLKRGEEDSIKGVDSIFAQLSDDFRHAQSLIVQETLHTIRYCPKNYQALVWVLERCFRKDFGSDSEEIKELIRNLDILNNARQGGFSNGEDNSQAAKQDG